MGPVMGGLLVRGRLCTFVFVALLTWPAFGGQGFKTLDGEPSSVAGYFEPERWLVVLIWSYSCPICRQEIASYVALSKRHTGGDIAVLGLSMDGEEGIADAWGFVAENDVSFPNLIGEPADVAEFYRGTTGRGFQGTPSLLLFAPGGSFKASQVGAVPVTAIEQFVSAHPD